LSRVSWKPNQAVPGYKPSRSDIRSHFLDVSEQEEQRGFFMDTHPDKSRWTFDAREQGICSLDGVSRIKTFLSFAFTNFFSSTNIPNGDVSKGELIAPYLQPFPPKGTGYHRHVFVLYKQDKKLDLQDLKLKDSADLEARTFSTFEFYRKHQDDMTPAGLSFFQANWDDSLTDFYHNVLNMKEPIFDYDYPEAFINNPVQFPHRQPFNLYLDKYSNPKDVNKRYLEEKLAKSHPFEGPEPALQFPNAHFYGDEPSWLKTQIKKKRLRFGRINDVEN
jgi:hypothetical protein